MRQFKAGVVQFDVQKGRIEANMNAILAYMDQLSRQDVRLAVLPEMFSCSFDNDHLTLHAGQSEMVLSQLSRKARQKNMAVAGSLPVLKDGRIFNTMVFIDTDGQTKGSYHKLHLFKLTKEDHYYAAGDQICMVDTSLGRIGLMICYDLRFPELARSLMLNDAVMLLVSAQWPTPRKKHWQTLLMARAIENQLYVIGTNRTGQESGLDFPGNSMVVDPLGNVLTNPGDASGTGWADIDFDALETARASIPCRADRRSDIYG